MSCRIVTVTLNPAIDQTAEMESFHPGEVNQVDRVQNDPGGKGINVASFLAGFGVKVTATGLLGQDNQAPFTKLFEDLGIDDRFFRVEGRNRTNIKLIDKVSGPNAVTKINYPGFTATQDRLVALQNLLHELMPTHDAFVLSGSLPPGLSHDTYHALITPLRAAGKFVVLDTRGVALKYGLQAHPDVIKPNMIEVAELVGTPMPDASAAVTAARMLHDLGQKTVIISMGADGAIFSKGDEGCLAVPLALNIRTPVGAGDAMVAGFTLATLRGMPLEEAATLATAFSIGALTQLGPRLPPPNEIEALMSKVTIMPLPV